jgi:hypothetical protein
VLGRESRTRGRQRRGRDAWEIESIIEKEDGAREREYEYKRRDRAVGNLTQLQQHNILKQTVLESASFKWEVDKSMLVSRTTPIPVLSSKLFLTTYTICQLIYCTNWEKVLTAQFEYLLNNVRKDLEVDRKASIITTFISYLSASEEEVTGREGRYTTRTFWDYCEKGNSGEEYKEIADIAKRLLVCTTSEAEPERVFSILRRIINLHRGRLSVKTLFFLLQIYLHGVDEGKGNEGKK